MKPTRSGLLLLTVLTLTLGACAQTPCREHPDCGFGFYCLLDGSGGGGSCRQDCQARDDCALGEICSSLGRCQVPRAPTQFLPSVSAGAAGDGSYLRWTLARGEDDALHDVDRPELTYPNPFGCSTMELMIASSGAQCGSCELQQGGTRQLCGDPADGIPYYLSPPQRGGGSVHMVVLDMYGEVARWVEQPPEVCVTVPLGRDSSCVVCANKTGTIDSSDCVRALDAPRSPCASLQVSPERACDLCVDLGTGQIASSICPDLLVTAREPSPSPAYLWGERCLSFKPPGTESDCAVCYLDDGVTYAACQIGVTVNSCFERGIEAFVGRLDQLLALEGFAASGLDADELARPEVALSFGGQPMSCDFYADGGYAPVASHIIDGLLWCGALGWDAHAGACEDLPTDCETDIPSFSSGATVGRNAWNFYSWRPDQSSLDQLPAAARGVETNSALPGCSPLGSPLLLDAGDGLALTPAERGVAFDLLDAGRQVRSAWPSSGALLALDLDLDGRIGSGAELFGEATRLPSGARAPDGFYALAQHDQPELGGDGDGRIDRRDAVFAALLVWNDEDHDGVSQPWELHAAQAVGLRALHLERWSVEQSPAWASDSHVGLRGLVEWEDGRVAEIYDVWLRFGPLDRPGS